jgi:hypothetical protein
MRRCVIAFLLLLTGCHYDIPLTAKPTQSIDVRLVGTWTLTATDFPERMDVRRYDDQNYVISYHGDLYRAFHSDAAGLRMISVQNLNDQERKWLFITWSLSQDEKTLTLRAINPEVVPNTTREAMVKALAAQRENPKLLGEPGVYRK